MTYSLLTVHRTNPDGTIDGAWLQDHVGSLRTARARAGATSARNSGTPIAVVKVVGWCSTGEIFHSQQRLA